LLTPLAIKYIVIQPFQILARFYPFVVFFTLMLSSLRVDLIVCIVVGVLLHFSQYRRAVTWLAEKLDTGVVGERMVSWGWIRCDSEGMERKPLD